jgi:hypothetical protein
MKIVTGKVRSSYVNVFEKRLNELSGKEEYSMMILIKKDDKETLQKINAAIEDAVSQKWPKLTVKDIKAKAEHWPLRDGDEEKDGVEPYGGHYFMNLKTQQKPGIIDKNRQEILDPSDFISGDYCRVSINSSAYEKAGKKGVSFYLNNVQFLEKGEPLSSVSRAEDDFQEWKESSEDWG